MKNNKINVKIVDYRVRGKYEQATNLTLENNYFQIMFWKPGELKCKAQN